MELLFERAKKEVWVRRRDVSVIEVGERSRRARGWVVSIELVRKGKEGKGDKGDSGTY